MNRRRIELAGIVFAAEVLIEVLMRGPVPIFVCAFEERGPMGGVARAPTPALTVGGVAVDSLSLSLIRPLTIGGVELRTPAGVGEFLGGGGCGEGLL